MSDDVLTHSSDSRGILSNEPLPVDQEPEIISLRPEKLDQYVGQKEVVETLQIAIEAAKGRSEPIEHVLLQDRWGLPEDVGKAVAMLARGDLAYSTGQVINVDGGLEMRRL